MLRGSISLNGLTLYMMIFAAFILVENLVYIYQLEQESVEQTHAAVNHLAQLMFDDGEDVLKDGDQAPGYAVVEIIQRDDKNEVALRSVNNKLGKMIGCSNEGALIASKLLDGLYDKSIEEKSLRSLLMSAHSSATIATKLLDRVIIADGK